MLFHKLLHKLFHLHLHSITLFNFELDEDGNITAIDDRKHNFVMRVGSNSPGGI